MAQMIGVFRLGRDVEVRYLQDGTAVANLALACNYGKKDSDGRRPTQWLDASLWGERAEKLAPYLLKGQAVYVIVEDTHIETFQTRDGGGGSKLVGRVASLEFVGNSQQDGQPSQNQGNRQQARQPAQRTAPQRTAPAPQPQDDYDDEIPF